MAGGGESKMNAGAAENQEIELLRSATLTPCAVAAGYKARKR